MKNTEKTMSPITQIKTRMKQAAKKLSAAQRQLQQADKNARHAAQILTTAREGVKLAEAEQSKLQQILKLEESTPSAGGKAKPGPKPKAAVKVKASAKKPGPKPKVAKKVKAKAKAKAKGKSVSRAAQGRREVASGKRPPIKDVIAKVLGKRVLHANEVYEAIKAKGQLPNSHDPRGYIGYLLSASKVVVTRAGKETEVQQFERVPEKGRGFYKNRGVAVSKAAKKPAPAKAAPKPAKAKVAPKAKAEKKTVGPVGKDGKRTVTCKKCGEQGHNSKGHDRAMAAKDKAAKPAKETKAAAPKAAATSKGPKTEGGKRTVTCKKCGQTGHNSKGHDRWAASQAKAATNGTSGGHAAAESKVEAKAEKTEAKAEPKAAASKDDSEKSTDEILAEAGIDAGAAI